MHVERATAASEEQRTSQNPQANRLIHFVVLEPTKRVFLAGAMKQSLGRQSHPSAGALGA
jgi:hypothetical protein